MASNTDLKLLGLDRIKEARLAIDNATTHRDREQALRNYDRAIDQFRQLVYGSEERSADGEAAAKSSSGK